MLFKHLIYSESSVQACEWLAPKNLAFSYSEMVTPIFWSRSNTDLKDTVPTAGAAGLDEAAQFRSLRSCKLQKGTWVFWLLMSTSFQSSLLWRTKGGQDCFFCPSVGWCLWRIIHLQCHMASQGLRITPEEGNWAGTEWFSFLLKIQRERHLPQKQPCLEDWGFDLSCALGRGWTSGQEPCRDRAASSPHSPSHLYANGTLWP